ncbi:kexin KEX2 SCDLUD_003039 [Saccharomycodes ludwigii]|uniref:kexin KEX2 n=1 Tax=Saccharomycodes ludwigii TaxID=36035 RepID=UPI001E8B3CA4|nr:hypothetical protein SCDLUD_003039 [Saccharomycodes ludwigii]KAH3901542.1 hypothetical protein SCDLUD_003039 [Saccharomycodes ludwigii]
MNLFHLGLQIISLSITLTAQQHIKVPPKNHTEKRYFAIETWEDIPTIEKLYPDWTFEHEVRGLEDHYVFSKSISFPNKRNNIDINSDKNIIFSFHDLPPKNLEKRAPVPVDTTLLLGNPKEAQEKLVDICQELEIKDPAFPSQWHLLNTQYPTHDLNVTDVWLQNITGKGVVTAIVDDGLDYESPDLKDNFCEEGSWDFNANTKLPKPTLDDDYHGTRCAGEIAAVKNVFCGVGVAYDSKVSGIRILSGQITTEDEAASLVYGLDVNDIYSCSWGPTDNGKEMLAPDELVKKSFIKGVSEGRNKKGAIYVFASGNGAMFDDNCNYDGYTNSIFSITVGAIDHKGLHPPYSESCSAVLVVTYSSGSGEYIHSTDFKDGCSDRHGGTSAAAPLAAGVYALVLEANPDLTWRDVQYLTILSSVEVDNKDAEWQETGSTLGKRYSHKYGYGKLDAYRIVEMAKNWQNVNPQTWVELPKVDLNGESKTNATDEVLESSIVVGKDMLQTENLKRIEHVTVTVNINSDIRGKTVIDLISPDGTVSHLGVVRRLDRSTTGFPNWTFMSVAHWGESGAGEWKLQVRTADADNNVELKDWQLKFYGESIDPEKTMPLKYKEDKDVSSSIAPDTSSTLTISSSLTTSPGTVTSDTTEEENSSTETTEIESSTPTPETTPTPEATPTPETTPVNDGSQEEAEQPEKIEDPDSANIDTGGQHSQNIGPEKHYFLFLFFLGFLLLLIYYIIFAKTKKKIKRRRAEAYEFDIIDSDSDYDSSVDQSESLTGMAAAQSVDDLENFDFDLSDEELLHNSSPVIKLQDQLKNYKDPFDDINASDNHPATSNNDIKENKGED